jgi:hypothetical protein
MDKIGESLVILAGAISQSALETSRNTVDSMIEGQI